MLGRSGMTSNTSSSIRLGNQIGKSASQLSAAAAAAAAAASNQAGVGGSVGAIGEKKRLKVQFIQPNTDKTQNLSFQINPKTWPNLRIADVIEISSSGGGGGGTGTSSSLVPASSSAQLSSQATNPVTSSSSNTSAATDEEATPFLVHVAQTSFNENIPPDTICIDKAASLAPFSIKGFSYVQATVVDRSQVTLDLVELIFKEQYLNGHDMLRIKKSLERTCVYLKKSVEFCSMKSMVKEMWAKDKDDSVTWVTCGYVGEKTRLVFRSQSAMCTIYIQMSREMWEFDVNGEMYHEKAINFLGELFTNWKNQSCSHDVTIALFSRIFYSATSRDQFPASIRTQIQQDNKGRFYEDFYRVVYQNERYEDWTSTLIILKRLIKEYRDYILNYHRRNLGIEGGQQMPEGHLSSAAEGNFLQTLNLSSSVFERQFVDRPFDRTGMMSLVITPGNGIYEVSRELTKITKERVIDNGIGSDLVCLGEQPLHAVPLFKYTDTSDTYCIPTWINLSFYKSSEIVRFCNSTFLPCSKIKIKKQNAGEEQSNLLSEAILPGYQPLKSDYMKSLEETDNIFENQPAKKTHSESFSIGNKRSTIGSKYSTSMQNMQGMSSSSTQRAASQQLTVGAVGAGGATTPSKSIQVQPVDEFDADEDEEFDLNSENAYANPFMPSRLKKRMSTQRRPWAHIFPLSEDGSPIFPNVFPNEKRTGTVEVNDVESNNSLASHFSDTTNILKQKSLNSGGGGFGIESSSSMTKVSPNSVMVGGVAYQSQKKKSFTPVVVGGGSTSSAVGTVSSLSKTSGKSNWEVSNFDETMAIVKTGVAWKSLTTPACLPLTTDFSPSNETWDNKFVRSSDYTLLLDVIREQYQYTTNQNTKKIKMTQVFQELMGHRLAMGFQLVVAKDYYTKKSNENTANGGGAVSTQSNGSGGTQAPGAGSQIIASGGGVGSGSNSTVGSGSGVVGGNKTSKNPGNWFTTSTPNYYKLSLGRMFHELYLMHDDSTNSHSIKVEIYTPKEEQSKDSVIEYRYRFQVPDSRDYNVSFCEISRKNIRALKQIWNPIDCYICIQGNGSLLPTDLARFWRQRIYMIPLMYVSPKTINETSQEQQSSHQQRSDSEPRSFSSSSTLTEVVHTQESTLQHYLNSFPNLAPSQIPQSMLPGVRKTVKCDIYTRKSPEELKFLRDYYFIKFMEGLNKLTRLDERRSYSKSTLAYLEANSGLNANSDNFLSATSVITNAINQLLVGSSSHSAVINPLQSSGNSGSMALLTQTPGSVGSTGSSSTKTTTQTIPTSLHKPAVSSNSITTTTNSNNATPEAFKKLISPKVWLLPAVQSFKNMSSPTSSSDYSSTSTAREEIVNYMHREYKEAMTSKSTGIPFIQDKLDIPKNCFISAEAVWWCIEHIEDILNEADAICFMHIACDFDLVKHISNQPSKIFIHGFYLYYIVTENSSDHLYTRDYCEVGYVDIDFNSATYSCSSTSPASSSSSTQAISRPSLVEIKDLLPETTNTLPVVANDLFKAYLKMFNQYSLAESNKSPETVTKQVNVDVDPMRKSEDRIEWASAVYRSHYHPLCAFELEVQWNIATGSLLSELVLGWAKLAKLNNLHIVAAPVDPFATPNTPNSDPLRGPIFVKLNLSCLTAQDESVLFENYIEQKYKSCFDEIFSEKYTIKEEEMSNNRTIAAYDNDDDDDDKNDLDDEEEEAQEKSSSLDSQQITELKRAASYDNTRVESVNKLLIDFLNRSEPKFEEFLLRKFITQENVKLKMRELDFVKTEFLEFIEYERTIRLQYFQEAILEKFGFVRNAAVVKTIMTDDYKDQPFFLHSSGGMFVMIPNYYNNDSMRSRHSSAATTTNTIVAHKSGIKNAISIADASTATATSSSSSLVPQQLDFSAATGCTNRARPILQHPNRRDRSITESGEILQRGKEDESYGRTAMATNINPPSSSYISSATAMLSSSSSARERSNTKSQPIQYFKLNEQYFLREEKEMIIEDCVGGSSSSNRLKTTNSGQNISVVGSLEKGQETLENSPSAATCANNAGWRMSFKKATSSASSFATSYQTEKDGSVPGCWSDTETKQTDGGGRRMPNYIESELFIGFWWSWNFMLGKKWRTQNTGDEAFQDNMLADFRQFCVNQDGRLKTFFEQSKPFLQ